MLEYLGNYFICLYSTSVWLDGQTDALADQNCKFYGQKWEEKNTYKNKGVCLTFYKCLSDMQYWLKNVQFLPDWSEILQNNYVSQ